MNKSKLKRELIKLVKIQTKTGNEQQMQEYIINRFANRRGYKLTFEKGNIYIDKGSALIKPATIAHTDTVHSITAGEILTAEVNGHIVAFDKYYQQIGTGGDDKNGILISLYLLDNLTNIKAAFFCEEESGGTGSGRANMNFFKNVQFAVQNDRTGHKEAVNNISGLNLWSNTFKNDIEPILKRYNFKTVNGGLTDVAILAENKIDISVMNLSCAYYKPHTDAESINFAELIETLNLNIDIFTELAKGKKIYTHEAKRATYQKQSYYNSWDERESWQDNDRVYKQAPNIFTAPKAQKKTSAVNLTKPTDAQTAKPFASYKQEFNNCPDCGNGLSSEADPHNGKKFCFFCEDHKEPRPIAKSQKAKHQKGKNQKSANKGRYNFKSKRYE